MRFINLHTHHISLDNSLFVLNYRLGFDKVIDTTRSFSIGVHPWDTELINETSFKQLEHYLTQPNCLVIGECGLDKLITTPLDIQKKVFEQHLQLAIKYKKPVIIHCVKAFDELIEICKPYFERIPLIIHGFNKSEQLAKQLIDKGFYLSLHHNLVLKTDFNIQSLPLNKLFFETDDNAHLLIQDIYQDFALKLNMELDVLKAQINRNFETLFL
jgi:TatD DNase family protein